MIIKVKPVIDYSVRGICSKAYPLHPKGCPNFGKRSDCPPGAFFWDKYIDMNRPMYAIVNKFDFSAHKNRMRGLHPNWSQRQVECCLYWQGTARKELRIDIKTFKEFNPPEYEVFMTPEAMGVNMTKTMASVGIILEWPPDIFVYKIALAGVPVDAKVSDRVDKQITLF